MSLVWWVAIAFALQAAAANFGAFLRARLSDSLSAAKWRWLAPYARAIWFIGPPYLALVTGAVHPQLYAVVDLDWRRTFETGLPITALAFLAGALLIWLHARGTLQYYPAFVLPASERRAQLSEPWGVVFVLLDSIALQAHWLFYRAGATLYLHDAYLGALGGMALVAAEWAADLRWWPRLRATGRATDLFQQMALLLLSTVLVIYTQNCWFVLATHALVWLGWLALMLWCYRPFTTADARPAGVHDA